MNPAFLHLALNHLPIVAFPIVVLLLGWGLFRRSREVLRLALGLCIAVAAITYPVFLTGESAEERVEEAAWASEDLIHEHEERAEKTLIVVLVTGGLAGIALWRLRGTRPIEPLVSGVVLAAVLVSAGMLAWTALAGGEIRHEEIRPGATVPAEARTEARLLDRG